MTLLAPQTREDWLYRARATAGAPLSWYAGKVMDNNDGLGALGDVDLILQYEYERVDANIPNFEYGAHRIQMLLSKRFAL